MAVRVDDGIDFDPDGVRAEIARRELDGYDGVKVSIRAGVGDTEVDLYVDIGFGDAVVPPARRFLLKPFLHEDRSARIYAYQVESVLAE